MKYNKCLMTFIFCIGLSMNTSYGIQEAYSTLSYLKTGGRLLNQGFNAVINVPPYISKSAFGALIVMILATVYYKKEAIKKWFNKPLSTEEELIKTRSISNNSQYMNPVAQIREKLLSKCGRSKEQLDFEKYLLDNKNKENFTANVKSLQNTYQNNVDLNNALLTHYRDELLDTLEQTNQCDHATIIQQEKDKCLFSPEEIEQKKKPGYSMKEPMLIRTFDGTNQGIQGLRYKAIEQVESAIKSLHY
jgi:hypothetical protein